jgi:hypothetical protein
VSNAVMVKERIMPLKLGAFMMRMQVTAGVVVRSRRSGRGQSGGRTESQCDKQPATRREHNHTWSFVDTPLSRRR